MGRHLLCGLLAGTLCCAAAAAQDAGVALLEGTLGLPDGTTVGAGAIVTIEAYDRTGAAVGEATFRPRSDTGPLPFSFGVPADIPVTLRAALVRDGRAELVSGDIPVGPGAAAETDIALIPFRPVGPAGRFHCGPTRLSLVAVPGGALLQVGPERLTLDPVSSGDGQRYEAPGTAIEVRGNTLRVTLDSEALQLCAPVPPALSDIWTAGGNEPGWRVDTGGGRLRATWDYGEKSLETDMPFARIEDGTLIYAPPGGDLSIRVRPELCYDDATGMPHPDTVELIVGDRTYPGCGGEPRDVLTGRVWRVETMFGKAMADDPPATLVFSPDGTLGGSTGCNVYRTDFEIGGETVAAGPLAATKRLCDEVLTQREAEFFIALRAADRFDFDDTGALVLTDDETAAPVLSATPLP